MKVHLSVNIVNIIATTHIAGLIDIEGLSQKLQHTKYDPEIFCGLVYKRKGMPTNIMFASGKISSHGAKSEKVAKQSIVETLRKIKDLGFVLGSAQMEKVKIENVVGTADLGRPLDIESMGNRLLHVIYEPEQFPGLIYRPFDSSIVCLVFATGKIVIVGGKSEKQIRQAFQYFKKVAEAF